MHFGCDTTWWLLLNLSMPFVYFPRYAKVLLSLLNRDRSFAASDGHAFRQGFKKSISRYPRSLDKAGEV